MCKIPIFFRKHLFETTTIGYLDKVYYEVIYPFTTGLESHFVSVAALSTSSEAEATCNKSKYSKWLQREDFTFYLQSTKNNKYTVAALKNK